MRRFLLSALFVVATISSALSATPKELEEIELLRSRFSKFYAATAPSEKIIKSYIDSLDTKTGGWRDIDYASTIGSGWRTKAHTQRTMAMAQFYVNESVTPTLFGRSELSRAIHSAWAYWFREKPYCPTNWYPNKLSCPRELGISFMLLQDEMSPEEQRNAVVVYNKSSLTKTGSNLLYVANTALMQGIFEQDTELINKAIDAVESTIFIAPKGKEGIQSDYSYHLHGAQQQFGNYGRAAMEVLAPFSQIIAGTSFAFDDKQMEILYRFITEGYRWVLWRGYLDLICSGRQYGRDMFWSKGQDMLLFTEQLKAACSAEQKAGIERMIEENSSSGKHTLVGQKHFDKSDCVVHRRPTWMAALRMHSTRVQGVEMSNNDNMRGLYSADGALFVSVDGGDYDNSSLLWDWRKVPGITCYERSDSLSVIIGAKNRWLLLNNSDFVGSCNDGESGITTFTLSHDGLTARKSWVMTPELILCLGADIQGYKWGGALTTSIDQKRQQAVPKLLQGKSWREVKGEKTIEIKSNDGEARFFHHRTGYIALGRGECVVQSEHRAEDWMNISRGYDSDRDSAQMFSLYLRHRDVRARYSYLILPDKTEEQTAKFDTSKVKIIANDDHLQLVEIEGVYYAAIFTVGRYQLSEAVQLNAKRAGLYMFEKVGDKGWRIISASDPTRATAEQSMLKMLEFSE